MAINTAILVTSTWAGIILASAAIADLRYDQLPDIWGLYFIGFMFEM
jgi:hypothetical protein